MRALTLLCLLLGACTTTAGQKVTVLLTNRQVTCVPQDDPDPEDDVEPPAVARLELDQPEDFYLAEFVSPATGAVLTLEGLRVDRVVTFECPPDVRGFTVRHATVLQAVRESSPGTVPAPTSDTGATP